MPGERQLQLFKGRKPRVAPPKEFLLHVTFVDMIKRSLMPGWHYTHLPFGEHRDPITGARLKRMGTQPGWPDFIFVGPSRSVFWLELKRKGGVLSESQELVRDILLECGFAYLCTDDLSKAIEVMRNYRIVRSITVSA